VCNGVEVTKARIRNVDAEMEQIKETHRNDIRVCVCMCVCVCVCVCICVCVCVLCVCGCEKGSMVQVCV